MICQRFLFVLLLAVGGALLPISTGRAHAQDSSKSTATTFQLSIGSTMDMQVENTPQKLNTETDLKYIWERPEPGKRVLSLQQTGVRVFLNGKTTLNTIMNQYGTATVENGKSKTTPTADTSDEVKLMLTDSYSAPLVILDVNEQGEVLKQEVVAKPGAKSQVDNGMITNCSLFHAPFFVDKEKFDRNIEISMGNGGFAKGTVTYRRAKDYDPKSPKLTVSGKATKDKFQPSSANPAMTLRNAVYDISGEQQFDPELGEWVAGTITMKVSFQLFSEEKAVGQADGTMTCKLSLPDQK